MNNQEEFKIRLDSYEFCLDECIKHEDKIRAISTELEEQIEEANIETAKRLSVSGFHYCRVLENLYGKFKSECASFRDFLSDQTDSDMKDCGVLVSEQINESQRNIEEALREHKKLFQEIIHNF